VCRSVPSQSWILLAADRQDRRWADADIRGGAWQASAWDEARRHFFFATKPAVCRDSLDAPLAIEMDDMRQPAHSTPVLLRFAQSGAVVDTQSQRWRLRACVW
jgi:hypothetical protein